MAARMKTSRAAVDRLFDDSNPSITLATLEQAATALGVELKIELIAAWDRLTPGADGSGGENPQLR